METEYKNYENIEQFVLLYKKYSLRSSAFDGRWWIDWLTKNANLCAYWHRAGTRTVPLQLYWIRDGEWKSYLVIIVRVMESVMETYIEIRELVCQHLNTIRWQSECIMNDVITGWRNRAFTNGLRHQEEIITEIRIEIRFENLFKCTWALIPFW